MLFLRRAKQLRQLKRVTDVTDEGLKAESPVAEDHKNLRVSLQPLSNFRDFLKKVAIFNAISITFCLLLKLLKRI